MGIKVAGLMIAKLISRLGLYIIGDSEYPSLIRGGYNNFTLRVSDNPIHAYDPLVDILVALNKNTLEENKGLVKEHGVVLFDSASNGSTQSPRSKKIKPEPFFKNYPHTHFVDIPMAQVVHDIGGDPILRNMVALGATLALFDIDITLLHDLLKETFEKKKNGDKIIEQNITVSQHGYDVVKQNTVPSVPTVKKIKNHKQMILTGNEAIGLGALRGGLTLYCAYPMTPATSILHFLAAQEKKYNIVVKQTEDEIAAIGMAIGGSLMGARSMVATSGGGFALMVESLGLAAITETPLVITLVMRPGPATGLPTWTGQGDLRFALHAAQDEFLRIVIAPGDIEECFFGTANALQLAEEFHVPVILLSDKFLAESYASTPVFDESKVKVTREGFADEIYMSAQDGDKSIGYRRYALTDSGVTPRSIPGQKDGVFIANSDEHDPYGFSEETSQNRIEQQQKRWKKQELILKKLPAPNIYGEKNADIALVSWGSSKRAVLEAQAQLKKQGIRTKAVHNMYVSPFPTKFYQDLALDPEKTIFVEGNMQGQFAGLYREHTGFDVKYVLTKFDGRQIFPFEIVEFVKNANILEEV